MAWRWWDSNRKCVFQEHLVENVDRLSWTDNVVNSAAAAARSDENDKSKVLILLPHFFFFINSHYDVG